MYDKDKEVISNLKFSLEYLLLSLLKRFDYYETIRLK